MAGLLILMALLTTPINSLPSQVAELISKAKSFDIYSIKDTGPKTHPSGTPNFDFLIKPTRYSDEENRLIRQKLIALRQDLGEVPNVDQIPPSIDINVSENPAATNVNENLATAINNETSDKAVKEKVYELAKYTIEQMNIKLNTLTTVHQVYKQNKMYKIGYIISYIHKTKENMLNLMTNIEKNKDTWDLLTLLNSYEQMKKTKEMLSDLMTIVNAMISNNQNQNQNQNQAKLNNYYTSNTENLHEKKPLVGFYYYDDSA